MKKIISIIYLLFVSSIFANAGELAVSTVTTASPQLYIDAQTGKDVKIGLNSIFVNGSNGNVGIGTINPAKEFHVIGNILSSTTIQAPIGNFTNAYFSKINTTLDNLTNVTVSAPVANHSIFYSTTTTVWTNKLIAANNVDAVYIQKVKAYEIMVKLSPVYIQGWDNTDNCAIVALADADDVSKMPCIGIINQPMITGQIYYDAVVVKGKIDNAATGGMYINDVLWVSNSSTLVNVMPTTANTILQKVGVVIYPNLTIGQIFVFGAGISMLDSYLTSADESILRALDTDSEGNLSAIPSAFLSIAQINAKSSSGLKLNDSSNHGLVIKNTGNVGIGTLTPNSKLHVQNYIKTSSGLKLPDGTILTSTAAASSSKVGYTTSDNVPKWTGVELSTSVIYDVSGNIGIGITNPANKLAANNIIESTSNGFKCPDGTVLISTNVLTHAETDPQVGGIASNGIPKWSGSSLETSSLYDSNNYIGIGVTNPTEALSILGAIKFNGTPDGAQDGTLYFDSSSNNIVYRNTYTWVSLTGGAVTYNNTVWQEYGGSVYLSTNPVGIITSTPTEKLEITGNILAGGKIISNKITVSTFTAKDGSGLFFDANNDGTQDVIFYPDGTISHAGGPGKLKVSLADTSQSYLIDKITTTVNNGINISKINPSADEKTSIDLNIYNMPDLGALADNNDFVILYDTGSASHKKVSKQNLLREEPIHLTGTTINISNGGYYSIKTNDLNSNVYIPDADANNSGTEFTLVKEDTGTGKVIIQTAASSQEIYGQTYQTIKERGKDLSIIADWNGGTGKYLKVEGSRFSSGEGYAQGAMQSWDSAEEYWKTTQDNARYIDDVITVGDGTASDNILMYIDTADGDPNSNSRLEFVNDYLSLGYRGMLYKNPAVNEKSTLNIETQDEESGFTCMVQGADAYNHGAYFNLYSNEVGGTGPRGWEIGKGVGSSPPCTFKTWFATMVLQLNYDGTVYVPNNCGIGTSAPMSRLDNYGALNQKVTNISFNYTAADEVNLLADASSGNVTIALPQSSATNGRKYFAKKTDSSSNVVTLDPNSAETIDGIATRDIKFENSAIEVVNNGTNCSLIGDYSRFGKSFIYSVSDALSTTTSTTFQEKLSMSAEGLTEGTYRISWSYAWYHTSAFNNFEARLQQDNTTNLMLHTQEPQDAATTQRNYASGYTITTLTAGNHTFDIDYRTNSNGVTSGIAEARIEIYRVN
ncbi:MAG: hypothetical protein ABH857_00655 [Elusimicrobiota bacterium]